MCGGSGLRPCNFYSLSLSLFLSLSLSLVVSSACVSLRDVYSQAANKTTVMTRVSVPELRCAREQGAQGRPCWMRTEWLAFCSGKASGVRVGHSLQSLDIQHIHTT